LRNLVYYYLNLANLKRSTRFGRKRIRALCPSAWFYQVILIKFVKQRGPIRVQISHGFMISIWKDTTILVTKRHPIKLQIPRIIDFPQVTWFGKSG